MTRHARRGTVPAAARARRPGAHGMDDSLRFSRGLAFDPSIVRSVPLSAQQAAGDHGPSQGGSVAEQMFVRETIVHLPFIEWPVRRQGCPKRPEGQGLDRTPGWPLAQSSGLVELLQGPLDGARINDDIVFLAVQPSCRRGGRAHVLHVLKACRACDHVHQRQMGRACISKLPGERTREDRHVVRAQWQGCLCHHASRSGAVPVRRSLA